MHFFSLFSSLHLPPLLFGFSFLVNASLATLAYVWKGDPRLIKKMFPLLAIFLASYGWVLASDIVGMMETHYLFQVFSHASFDSVTHRSLLAPFPFLSILTVGTILFVYRRHGHESHASSYLSLARTLCFLSLLAMGMLALESYF
jgi:hypothetical protein